MIKLKKVVLAACLIATSVTSAIAQTPVSWRAEVARKADMEYRSEKVVNEVLASRSAERFIATDFARYYGYHLNLNGSIVPLEDVIIEARKLAQEWPVRSYAASPASMKITCDEDICLVIALVNYRKYSPKLNEEVRGQRPMHLAIDFAGPRPQIIYESTLPYPAH